MRTHAPPAPRPAAPAARRLEFLYEIGCVLLSPFEGVADMMEAVLEVVVRPIPLRSAILIARSGSRVSLYLWHSPGDGAERLAALKKKAEESYAYVTGLTASGIETREAVLSGAAEEGEQREPVVIPLALRDQPSSGIILIEPARPLDEADLAFANTAVNLISIALDRLHGRQRETALREQAEQAEKEARRVNENLERLVAERTAQLHQTIKDLHSFAFSIAHDLRAPLRHLHGYSEFLLGSADAASQPYARRIMAATVRMDRLIEDLLQYSRLTLEDVKTEPLEPSPVMSRVIGGLEAEIRERGALIDVQEPLPRVLGHPVPLTQIFENLLSNALKFTARGVIPRIRVGGEKRGDLVRLFVEDNGIGVDPAHQKKIFEVFKRLHKTEEFPGTGIGLAIVRRAAERMGGCVGVESPPGGGSRFWVDLKAG